MGSKVLQYLSVQELPNLAFKVKIVQCDLRKAMDSGHRHGALWTSGGNQV